MSTYATIQGYIVYPDKDTYDKKAKMLIDVGWIDKDGYFVDENESTLSDEPSLEPKHLTINIPFACHRNLIRYLDDLMQGAIDGKIVYTCTDGTSLAE